MKNIRLLLQSAVFVLPLSMSAAVCEYKLSFDKSMIDFGNVSNVKKMSVKLTNESIGDNCDLNIFQLYSTKQGQGVFSNSNFSGTIAQNSSIDIEVTMTPNYTDNITKYEDSDLFVHAVGVDSDGKKHYVKNWVDYRGIELPKQSGEVINGYTLPPKPDPKINNSTLLGVDSNDNGVRDDVERYIIKKYKNHHKIVTEIGFQKARAYQKMLENPLDWEENLKALDAASDCNYYFEEIAEEFGDPILIDHVMDLRPIQLNTKSRIRAYLTYDKQLSGGVYRLTPYSEQKSKCSSEIKTLLGGE